MNENIQKSIWRGRFFRYAPLVLWIGIILSASTSMGAISNTSRFIRPLLNFLFPPASEETILGYQVFIRKLAHLTVYSILAFWAARAFWSSSKMILQKYWYVFSFLTVLLVASTDEYNQSFNSLRTGAILDIFLDALGGAAMIGILLIFKKFKTKPMQRKHNGLF